MNEQRDFIDNTLRKKSEWVAVLFNSVPFWFIFSQQEKLA